MHRISDVVGKPVLSVSGGAKLGTVADVLLAPGGVQLIALVVTNGMLSKEHVLPLEEVQRLGRDAVLARSDEHLMSPREWREADTGATRSSALRGRRVVTAGGRELGHVSDLLVDDETGAFGGLEVEGRSLGGLKTHRTVIPATPAPRIGPDAIVVDESVAPDSSGDARAHRRG